MLRTVNALVFLILIFSFLAHTNAARADITFNHVTVDAAAPTNPHTKSVGDINGDGFIDLLAASSANGPLVWYEFPHWTKHIIANSGRWSTDAEVGDIDGDGDNDVVISDWHTNNRIEWYENPGPAGDPANDDWTLHVIGNPRAHDIELGDLDRDDDLDIVTRQQGDSGNKLEIWLQQADQTWIHRSLDIPSGEGLHLDNLDNDEDPDLVIAGRWYETPADATSGTFTEHVFMSSWTHSDVIVAIADINRDERLDIVLTPSESEGGTYRTSWFEAPSDPRGGGWIEHVIDGSIETVTHSLGAADMDNDGDLDIVTAEMHQSSDPDEVRIYFNQDGSGLTWEKQVIASTGSHNMRVVDVGNDGDFDLFGANWSGPHQPCDLWENTLMTDNEATSWGELKSRFRGQR